MNIWVPYANLRSCLNVLTDDHLFDVLYVGLDTLRALYGTGGAGGLLATQWRSGAGFLLGYVMLANNEAEARGHKPEDQVKAMWVNHYEGEAGKHRPPWWFGDPLLHETHRSNLIRIDPEHYAQRLPMTTRLDMKMYQPKKRG